jgi:hypothetical protein
MKLTFLLTLLLCLALSSARATGDNSTVSDELKQFLKKAEYIVVCEKKGMTLFVVESLLGSKKRGEIQAHYETNLPPPYTISPEESWKDLLIWLPSLHRLAYYRIEDGRFEWFDAKDRKNRFVKLSDLRAYYKKK